MDNLMPKSLMHLLVGISPSIDVAVPAQFNAPEFVVHPPLNPFSIHGSNKLDTVSLPPDFQQSWQPRRS
jgi:hypothetical protein